MKPVCFGLALAAILPQASLRAQPASPSREAPPPDETPPAEDEPGIFITGTALRGSTIIRAVPEISLGADEIAAFGLGSIGAVLEQLQPQTGGQPITLINGRRISSFEEVDSLPPEAIERMDILPPDVALAYGFRADRRVVNIVLRERYRGLTVEADGVLATDAGRDEQSARLVFTRLRGNERLAIDLELQRAAALFASERGLRSGSGLFDPLGNVIGLGQGGEIDPALSALAGTRVVRAGVPAASEAGPPSLGDFLGTANNPNSIGDGQYRSLLPVSENAKLSLVYARPIAGMLASITAGFRRQRTQSAFGLPGAVLVLPGDNPFSPFATDVLLYRAFDQSGALTGASLTDTAQLGLSLNGSLTEWMWSFTANAERIEAEQRTDRGVDAAPFAARLAAGDPAVNPFGPLAVGALTPLAPDRVTTVSTNGTADFVAAGTVAPLPAGGVIGMVSGGFAFRQTDSEGTRAGTPFVQTVSGDSGQVRASLFVPLASRRNAFLPALGELNLNLAAGRETVAGVGSATNFDIGATWMPVQRIRLSARLGRTDGLPPIAQRALPVVETPNVQLFDFASGTTVNVTRVDGGNGGLRADERRIVELSGEVRPFARANVALRFGFQRNAVSNPVRVLPAATAEIEAIFPERFQRDPSGRLVRVDARPINFARSVEQQLRWGLFASLPFARRGASAVPGAPAVGRASSSPPARVAPSGPLAAAAGGRLNLTLSHTWLLSDRLVLREGFAPVDFVADAGFGGRGRPRHRVDGTIVMSRDGLGVTLLGSWESASRLSSGANALRFSDLARADLRLVANLGAVPAISAGTSWIRRLSVTLEVRNLFDRRILVRDAFGVTPPGYEGASLDPLGRSVRLGLRLQM